jgi:hypothetical protein
MSNSVESSWVDELIQNSHDCGACVPDRASAEPTEMMVKLVCATMEDRISCTTFLPRKGRSRRGPKSSVAEIAIPKRMSGPAGITKRARGDAER